MNTLSYKTVSVSKEAAREQKEWVVIDATDQVAAVFVVFAPNLVIT